MNNEDIRVTVKDNGGQLNAGQQAAIARLGLLAMTCEELSDLFAEIARVITDILSADLCLVLEYDPSSMSFLMRASQGLKGDDQVSEQIGRLNDTILNKALGSPEPLIFGDLQEEQLSQNDWLIRAQGVTNGMNIVIGDHANPHGLLGVYTRSPRKFTPNDINFLQSIANLLAAALHRRQFEDNLITLNEHLEDQVVARTKLITLLQEIAIATNEDTDIPEVMRRALDMICSFTGWPLGHVFYCKSPEIIDIVSTSIWSYQESERWSPIIEASAKVRQWSKTGLPGRVLASGKPEVVSNLTHLNFSRAEAAQQSGVKAGFAFPIMVGKDVVAIMEFFHDQPIEPDAKFVEVLSHIGSQLGVVVERRRTEEVIRANQERLIDAQNIAKLGTWEWDILSNKMIWSDNLYRIFDLSPQDFRNAYEGFLERVHPDDRPVVDQAVQQAYTNHKEFNIEHRIVKPDGVFRTLHTHGKVITDTRDKAIKIIGICQDVTEIKLAIEKIRTGEELLQRVVTAAPIILWATDKDGHIILAEGRSLSLLGITSKDDVVDAVNNFFMGRKDVPEHIHIALSGKEVVAEINADTVTLETRYTPSRDESGEISGVIGVSIDVSERERMLAALRSSETRFRTIFENSAIGISIIDLSQRFLVANPALQSMLGYNQQELIGMELAKMIPLSDHPSILPHYQAALEGEEKAVNLEQRFLQKSEGIIWVNSTITLIRNDDGSPRFAILMVEDITPRKQMEAELAEVNKRLVAGRERERLYLAQELHDEPLQELYGLLYQLEDLTSYALEDEGVRELKESQLAVNRIINTLRGICRELRPPALVHFGLEGAIRELAERFLNEHPEIKLDLDLMYDGQLLNEQVRLTLYRILQQALINVARHAQASNVHIRFKYNQDSASLEVEDDGIGFMMPARWVSFVREGHLGLAGAAERAETVNGQFQVISSPGKGTLLRVTIPQGVRSKDQGK